MWEAATSASAAVSASASTATATADASFFGGFDRWTSGSPCAAPFLSDPMARHLNSMVPKRVFLDPRFVSRFGRRGVGSAKYRRASLWQATLRYEMRTRCMRTDGNKGQQVITSYYCNRKVSVDRLVCDGCIQPLMSIPLM
jgi:hypothetical protein